MERFRDVVVRAQVQTLRLVGRRALGREEDHGDGSPLPELAHDLDPVEIGHHDIQEDDVGPDLLGLLERFLAAVRRDDTEALLTERDGDEVMPVLREELSAVLGEVQAQAKALHTLDGRLQVLPQLVAAELRAALAHNSPIRNALR